MDLLLIETPVTFNVLGVPEINVEKLALSTLINGDVYMFCLTDLLIDT